MVTWFFSREMTVMNGDNIPTRSLLGKHAPVASGIFPSAGVRGLGSVSGIHFPSKVAAVSAAVNSWPCSAVLQGSKSCSHPSGTLLFSRRVLRPLEAYFSLPLEEGMLVFYSLWSVSFCGADSRCKVDFPCTQMCPWRCARGHVHLCHEDREDKDRARHGMRFRKTPRLLPNDREHQSHQSNTPSAAGVQSPCVS